MASEKSPPKRCSASCAALYLGDELTRCRIYLVEELSAAEKVEVDELLKDLFEIWVWSDGRTD